MFKKKLGRLMAFLHNLVCQPFTPYKLLITEDRESEIVRAALGLVFKEGTWSVGILFGGDRWGCVEIVAVAVHRKTGVVLGLGTLAPTNEMGGGGPNVIGIWVTPSQRKHGIGLALIRALAGRSLVKYKQEATVWAITAGGVKLCERAIKEGVRITYHKAVMPGFELP